MSEKNLYWNSNAIDTLIVCVEDEKRKLEFKQDKDDIDIEFLESVKSVHEKLLLWEHDIIYGKQNRKEKRESNKKISIAKKKKEQAR
jgi:hypothetical protein